MGGRQRKPKQAYLSKAKSLTRYLPSGGYRWNTTRLNENVTPANTTALISAVARRARKAKMNILAN